MGGNTIRKEWFDFWDFSPDMASVPAFCQQRQKLLPETMDFLFHSFNDSFSSLETYRGFRLLACDKSDLAIAYTPDDKDTYMIIPGLFEPPVRTLRATIPENESHIFR